MIPEFATNIYDLLINEADKKMEEYIVINYEQLNNPADAENELRSASKKRSKSMSGFKAKSTIQRTFTMKKVDEEEQKKEVERILTQKDED